MSEKVTAMIEEIKALTVLELSELVHALEEEFGVSSKAADTAEAIQEKTSFLPDYAFADNDSAAGTTVSGIAGSAIVAGVALLICLAGGFFRKRKKT